jgi:hypothetical protein
MPNMMLSVIVMSIAIKSIMLSAIMLSVMLQKNYIWCNQTYQLLPKGLNYKALWICNVQIR